MKRQHISTPLSDQPTVKKNTLGFLVPADQPDYGVYSAPPTPPYQLADQLLCPSLETPVSGATDGSIYEQNLSTASFSDPQKPDGQMGTRKTGLSTPLLDIVKMTVTDSSTPCVLPSGHSGSLEAFQKSAGGRLCDGCIVTQFTSAIVHCLNCLTFYCAKCLAKHNTSPVFRDHVVNSVEADVPQSELYCPHHPSHFITHICEACEPKCLVCPICMLNHNQAHSMFDLRGSARRLLVEGLDIVKVQRDMVHANHKQLFNTYKLYKQLLPQALQATRDWALDQINEIRKQEEELLQRAENKLKNMKRKVCESESMRMERINLCIAIKEVLTGSDKDCFAAYGELKARIEKVQHCVIGAGNLQFDSQENVQPVQRRIDEVPDDDINSLFVAGTNIIQHQKLTVEGVHMDTEVQVRNHLGHRSRIDYEGMQNDTEHVGIDTEHIRKNTSPKRRDIYVQRNIIHKPRDMPHNKNDASHPHRDGKHIQQNRKQTQMSKEYTQNGNKHTQKNINHTKRGIHTQTYTGHKRTDISRTHNDNNQRIQKNTIHRYKMTTGGQPHRHIKHTQPISKHVENNIPRKHRDECETAVFNLLDKY